MLTASNAALGIQAARGAFSGEQVKLWGTFLQHATDERALVLVPSREDRVLQYYVDRRMGFGIDSPAKLDEAIGESATVFSISEREAGRLPALVQNLDKRSPYTAWYGLRLYSRVHRAGMP